MVTTATSLGAISSGERMRPRRFKLRIGGTAMAMRGGRKKKKKTTSRGGRRRK